MKTILFHPARCRRALSTLALFCLVARSPLCAEDATTKPVSAEIAPPAVLAAMKKVADWQLANPSGSSSRYAENAWTWGACYAGMMALAGISDDPKYHDAMLAMGRKFEWKPARRLYHADDQCVAQTYLELYLLHREPAMLQPIKERCDYILANRSSDELDYAKKGKADRWWWCDALFMGPAVWARLYTATGDPRYLDFLCKEWWVATDFLYDKDEHLYFRDSRYFTQHEANGKKVFWSRGNGWVVGGLVRVLQYLPANHPDRPRFEQLFKDMCNKLLTCQQSDGLWRASLLDPDSYPLKETSGSGFFTYGLAWGVNQGLLDRAKFEPAVHKGWDALVGCVQTDGKLTHVQPVGADPKKFDENATEVYGVGAYLLAGSEVYRMAVLAHARPVGIEVANPADFHRVCETVELDLKAISATLKLDPVRGKFAVMTTVSSKILDAQVYASQPGQPPDKLLFQVDLAPNETRQFVVLDGSALAGTPPPIVKTYARLITERFNDMAWESDRTAHRMYQQDLIKGEGTISSGIDVWSKRTRNLVVDKWYKDGNYHEDHGGGLDDYRVGRSRGCGGLGIWDGKQLYNSINFREGRVLATGPIRSEFELIYDTWDAAGRKVSEVKRISIDAGSNLSRAQSVFTSDNKSPLAIGVGIAQRPVEGIVTKDQAAGWMTYWQPADRDRGNIGCAVVLPTGIKEFIIETNSLPVLTQADIDKPSNEGLPPAANLLAITRAEVGKPFVYYFGAGWGKSGDFPDAKAWEAYVREFARRLQSPLRVSM